MTDSIQTDGIAKSFSHAAETYDHWARPQRIMAKTLMACLPETLGEGPILDVGCGTGLLTEYLLQKYSDRSLLGIDIAPGMIAHCETHFTGNPNAGFAVADGEKFTARRVPHQAGFFQNRNERCGTAVHDRYFRSVNIDMQVIHTVSGECGQQVLNRGDANISFADDRRQASVDNIR